ncbi:peptide ABC transporter substrate-binding protein [Rhizobium sp. P32RR-XVIII]|uniref:ABC transporter substrate-binding protein n=1 Tax=Rhizobium sp. P32RR-XVIII TaxID=2726738 RepID=UPI0014575F69|nr:ABC transporter substrate-binding protein [Rhizobium sp. P32RR-XVIII]NLS07221.1 peptide ABC transporter substrate-binding protein [Rhizobium sp. P32RR-XVIII]
MKINRLFLSLGLVAALSSPSQAQDKSGDITIVLSSAVDVVEPCHMNSTGYIGQVLKGNVVETLTRMDPQTSEIKPNLATEWKQTDPQTWQIKLRQGVKFQDGTNFNADAVIAALNRQFSPQLQCRDTIRLFGQTTIQTKALDPYTVEIKASTPVPLMPTTLSQIGMTAPSTSTTEVTKSPVGTGPYVFSNWDPASKLVLTRFDGYWGKKPQVHQATYVWREEPALRASMVKVGEADLGLQIAPQDVDPNLDVGYLNADTSRIRIFMDKPPLNDVRIRKALNMAFDRSAFLGTIMAADAKPASQYMLPSVNGYDDSLKPWPYDPEKAKALVAEAKAAGVPVDTPIDLYGSVFMQANLDEMLQTLVQSWQEIGLNVQIRMVDKIQHSAMRRKPYPTDRGPTMVHELHDNTAGDAFFTMMVYYTSAGALSNISDPTLDETLTEASISTGDKRRQLFQQANRTIQQDIVPDIMLFHMVSYMRIGQRVSFKPDFTTGGQLELAAITLK